MFRRFDFEKEIYPTLEFVPMSVRRKLDLVGVKLHLNQWQALSRAERLIVCHFPAESPEECTVLADFLREAVKRRADAELKTITPTPHDRADKAEKAPPEVTELAAKLKLPEMRWSLFDPDERFALNKLARGETDKFARAWSEFTQKPKP